MDYRIMREELYKLLRRLEKMASSAEFEEAKADYVKLMREAQEEAVQFNRDGEDVIDDYLDNAGSRWFKDLYIVDEIINFYVREFADYTGWYPDVKK